MGFHGILVGFNGISLGIEWDFIGISCEYNGNIRGGEYGYQPTLDIFFQQSCNGNIITGT